MDFPIAESGKWIEMENIGSSHTNDFLGLRNKKENVSLLLFLVKSQVIDKMIISFTMHLSL